LDIVNTTSGKEFFEELKNTYLQSKHYDKANFSQAHIITNMIEFINVQSKDVPNQEYNSDIKILIAGLTEGNCAGFSFLYGVYKMLGTGHVFFYNLKTIAKWDKTSFLSGEDKEIFEEMIGQVALEQDTYSREFIKRTAITHQNPFDVSEIILPNNLQISSDTKIYRQQKTLEELSKDLSDIPIGKPIYITIINSHFMKGHAICIYRSSDDGYAIYDPNNKEGELFFNDPQDLANKIMRICIFPETTEFTFMEYVDQSTLPNDISLFFKERFDSKNSRDIEFMKNSFLKLTKSYNTITHRKLANLAEEIIKSDIDESVKKAILQPCSDALLYVIFGLSKAIPNDSKNTKYYDDLYDRIDSLTSTETQDYDVTDKYKTEKLEEPESILENESNSDLEIDEDEIEQPKTRSFHKK
jgi:hypothetical protein